MHTYILLNVGTKTRKAFSRGFGDLPMRRYKSKHLLMHIKNDGAVSILHRNTPIHFEGTRIFTRLASDDTHFCGMLYEFFSHHRIPANDMVHLSYTERSEKIAQMLQLALHDIPIPESFIFREESLERNRKYLESHISFPAVFKTDGRKGEQVSYLRTWAELEACMKHKEKGKLALVQPFISNTFDTRTLVAYGSVLGSIARTRTDGYRNNLAHGATASAYVLTSVEEELACKAATICGIDFGGVDMIHTPEGPVLLEVNKSPQIAGFESVYGYSVFERIAMKLRTQD